MGRYAAQTSVSVDKSKAEIERTLRRYGAEAFMYGWEGNRALIGFKLSGKSLRMELPLPKQSEFVRTETGRQRQSQEAVIQAWE